MIDVSAASPWVKPAQGLIRLAKQAPYPPAPVTPHSHRIFSHYSGADRWASFCISAVHFLKSEKPIHLGQTQKEKEEEAVTKEKLQNFSFFFLLCCSLPAFKCHSRGLGAPPPHLHQLRHLEGGVDVPRLQKGYILFHWWKDSIENRRGCLCFVMDWINLSFQVQWVSGLMAQ